MKKIFYTIFWAAGLLLMALLPATTLQAQTVDLSTHQPLPTSTPAGAVFEWHSALPPSAANLMTAAQIAAAGPGLYYGVYHFTAEDCYSVPAPLRIAAPVCPATTVDLRKYVDSSAKPAGTVVTWHNASPVSNANRLSAAAAGAAGPGTYFTAYLDTAAGCYSNASAIVVAPSSSAAPLLTTQSPVCSGTTYSVIFASSGTVSASAGAVSGNMVSGIPVGTNVVLTANGGCATTVATVTSPTSCTNPPTGCTTPNLSAGQGVCIGTGFYSVAFNVNAGATVSASAGTVSGNTIINIPITGDVVITAVSGSCSTSVTITRPADCTNPCATPGASFSAGICSETTYSINISNPNNATITASAGEVTATAITGIDIGTDVIITVTAPGCAPQTITISSPSKVAPLLTTQSAVCNGTTYSVAFSSNGIVSASAGSISGNMVTGIPVGTNLVLTAASQNGCATTVETIESPASCINPPIGCVTPTLSAGQGVCTGTGTYSVAFNASAGAIISVNAGIIIGNTITDIPLPFNVYITATSGSCSTTIIVAHPEDCNTPCATPGASFSAGICTGTTYSINISNPNNAVITTSTGTLTPTAITGIAIGTDVTVTSTATGCTTQTITIASPSKAAPLLTTQSAVCNGTTYSVAFSSNGIVTASAGSVSGNSVINIPVGTNLVLTAASVSGCATTVETVASPASCTNPPTGCTSPSLSAGQGVCTGTGFYSVAFNVSAGATVTTSAGSVSGNTIINIPIAGDVIITATSGTCTSSITVTHPADCSTPCATPGASFSAGICTGTTYSINISNPNGAVITASTGAVGATAITGIAIGTNVTITATAAGCTTQTITINSPSGAAPLLTTQSAVCNGTTYSVTYSSNGIVTASAGSISGNTVINIPVGTNLVLTAASVSGCATTVETVASPASCTNPPTGCTTPSLSAGQGVCTGTGTYSVAFNASSGATVSSNVGSVAGNTIINIPIASNVVITATSGTCTSSITVNHPADCNTPCATPGASFSAGICTGTTYSINISNPNGAAIAASTGAVGATAITGIAIGTNVTITATAAGCISQTITINSPSGAAPLLTTQSAVCNGTSYTVAFSSNGIVTASAGLVSGNSVINIPVGTNLVLTAKSANGCATTVTTVTSPASCTNPPTGCVTPTLSAGQGVCTGTGSYSVAFNVSTGAIISTSAGTVSGNTIINIPIGSDMTITATNGACVSAVTIQHPADCGTVCATPGASFSMGVCGGTSYTVNISNPGGAVITASAGSVTPTAITNIPFGTNVTITVTAAGCVTQVLTINAPNNCGPDLTPVIKLTLNTLNVGDTRDFVVRLNEITNNATAAQIAFNISVPTGYVLTFDNTQVSSNVLIDQVYPVSNPNWVTSINSPSDMDLQSKPGFIINANSNTVIGFKVRRTAAALSGSVGNIVINIYPDPSRLYDSNNLNNIYSRIINAN